MDNCTLPMDGSPTFSCFLEEILWLCRHEDDPLVEAWWIGFEFGQKGRSFERVVWKLKYGG
jgi:hypothetical protein